MAIMPKRTASEQVAFRVEPKISSIWSDFVADSLIPNRAHHVCAMLLYLGASAQQRDAVQRLYARFGRSGDLDRSALASVAGASMAADLTDDERHLLQAYRQATEVARDEAIANLLDQRDSASRKAGTDGTRDHRVG